MTPVIVGAPRTVKACGLLALPFVFVTATVPEVALAGTVATMAYAVEETTLAAVPLNVTVFLAGVGSKP